jgi:hypothetical protein
MLLSEVVCCREACPQVLDGTHERDGREGIETNRIAEDDKAAGEGVELRGVDRDEGVVADGVHYKAESAPHHDKVDVLHDLDGGGLELLCGALDGRPIAGNAVLLPGGIEPEDQHHQGELEGERDQPADHEDHRLLARIDGRACRVEHRPEGGEGGNQLPDVGPEPEQDAESPQDEHGSWRVMDGLIRELPGEQVAFCVTRASALLVAVQVIIGLVLLSHMLTSFLVALVLGVPHSDLSRLALAAAVSDDGVVKAVGAGVTHPLPIHQAL